MLTTHTHPLLRSHFIVPSITCSTGTDIIVIWTYCDLWLWYHNLSRLHHQAEWSGELLLYWSLSRTITQQRRGTQAQSSKAYDRAIQKAPRQLSRDINHSKSRWLELYFWFVKPTIISTRINRVPFLKLWFDKFNKKTISRAYDDLRKQILMYRTSAAPVQ